MINEETFQIVVDAIPNILIMTDGKKIVKSNRAFLNFFSLNSLQEFSRRHQCVCDFFIRYKDYFTSDMIEEDVLWTDYLYTHGKLHKVSMLDNNKEPRAFEISIERLGNYKEKYIVVFTDITEIEKEKKLLEKMAYYDPLTGIYNRKMFIDMLEHEKENKKRHGDRLALIMFDIDHFKNINDTYGHDVGDKVLIALANVVKQHLRVNDVFARWGGEEFMILLPRTDVDAAYHKAQQLRKIVEEYDDNTIPKFTISLGVTEVGEDDREMFCYKRVDSALYQAKIKRNDVAKLDN